MASLGMNSGCGITIVPPGDGFWLLLQNRCDNRDGCTLDPLEFASEILWTVVESCSDARRDGGWSYVELVRLVNEITKTWDKRFVHQAHWYGFIRGVNRFYFDTFGRFETRLHLAREPHPELKDTAMRSGAHAALDELKWGQEEMVRRLEEIYERREVATAAPNKVSAQPPLGPTEELILRFLSTSEARLNGKEIARRLKLKGGCNSNFRTTLSSLEKRGMIDNPGRGKGSRGYAITETGRTALQTSQMSG